MSTNGKSRSDKSDAKKGEFLEALDDLGMVTEAAKAIGKARSTVYKWRNEDPSFAEAWADVEEKVTEDLEHEAYRRAKEGSDVLLIFLLKAHRPERYRERLSIDDDRDEARRRRELERATDEELDRALTGIEDNVVPIRKAS